MMKVYAVRWSWYEDSEEGGVYSTLKKAKERVKFLNTFKEADRERQQAYRDKMGFGERFKAELKSWYIETYEVDEDVETREEQQAKGERDE
jgi:hypothetical protein